MDDLWGIYLSDWENPLLLHHRFYPGMPLFPEARYGPDNDGQALLMPLLE